MIPHSKPWINERDRLATAQVLETGMISNGLQVRGFESELASYLSQGIVVATSSGSSALELALRVLEVGDNDEVILPTYVCRSVIEAVMTVRANPVLVDVNEYGLVTCETIRNCVRDSTKAIIAVHIFGRPCDIPPLKEFGVPVIEDCCQSFGSGSHGGMTGTHGDLAVYSFHATKCLTTGEGGALGTSNRVLSERVNRLLTEQHRPQGRFFSVMTDLQAALGRSQLDRIAEFRERRLRIATFYDELIAGRSIHSPARPEGMVPFRYIIHQGATFDAVQAAFAEREVSVRRGVDQLLHRLMGMPDDGFPCASRLFDRTVSLPIFPALTERELDQISNALSSIELHD